MRIFVRIIRTKNSQNIRQHAKSIKKPIFPGMHLPFPESKQSTAPEAFASKNRAAIANYWFLFIFFLLPTASPCSFVRLLHQSLPCWWPRPSTQLLTHAVCGRIDRPRERSSGAPGRVGNSCLLLMFDSLTAARVRSGLTIESYNTSFQPRLTILFFLFSSSRSPFPSTIYEDKIWDASSSAPDSIPPHCSSTRMAYPQGTHFCRLLPFVNIIRVFLPGNRFKAFQCCILHDCLFVNSGHKILTHIHIRAKHL